MSNTVLVVENDGDLREALCDTLKLAGFPVAQAADGSDALTVLERKEVGMIVSDVQMTPMDGLTFLERIKNLQPELPVLMMTAYGSIDGAVRAMRSGALDYLQKPFEAVNLIERVKRALAASRGSDPTGDEFIAFDYRSKELIRLARRVAVSGATVLISGESGTGKEVLARFIHRVSLRASGPFVAINCAAIPENLLEATLFGYEKGAFTGAHRASPGKFEQAQGGTLLLDEISEMDLGLQAKLLRVLQEREVERIGGRQTITLDVRVVATTNRELRTEVVTGRFREDLFYRINVFPLMILPLRERVGDILPIAQSLLQRQAREAGRSAPSFSDAAVARLRDHAWSGNVREMDNLIQRAMILRPGQVIDAEDLCFEEMVLSDKAIGMPKPLDEDLRSREHTLIVDTLRRFAGNRQATAERLGISPRTLRYKLARMRELGIAIPGDAGDSQPRA